MDKPEEDTSKQVNKNMVIVRSLDRSCNTQRTIPAVHHKNDQPIREKNEKTIFVIRDNMVKHLNGWQISKKLTVNYNVSVKTFSGAKTT